MIHCIGDSHTRIFTGQVEVIQPFYPKLAKHLLPDFITYKVTHITAHNAYKELPTILSILENVSKEDYVLLSFGEIDMRCHIKVHSEKQSKPASTVIKELAKNYFNFVLDVKNIFSNVMVYNVIAQGIPTLPIYYYHGTVEERNDFSKQFNSSLKFLCFSHRVRFIETFNLLVTKDNKTKDGIFIEDGIHLNKEWIKPTVAKVYGK